MTAKPDSVLRPLTGRTIVITRAQSQAGEFAAALENYGANVLVCPTIDITDPESYSRLDEALDHLYGYDWLIFSSVNGVEHFLRRARIQQRDVSELSQELKVCAIGEATAHHLRTANIHVDLLPAQFKAEGVFAALEQFVGGREALRGLNFLIPRAAVARDYLPKNLESAGARVDVVEAYRTVIPAHDRGHFAAMLAGGTDCIAFTSSSAVRNLGLLFDTTDLSQVLAGISVACIGDVTASTAMAYGLSPEIQPEEFTIPALAAAIAQYFGRKLETLNIPDS